MKDEQAKTVESHQIRPCPCDLSAEAKDRWRENQHSRAAPSLGKIKKAPFARLSGQSGSWNRAKPGYASRRARLPGKQVSNSQGRAAIKP